jgi:hypothetical protein
MTDRSVEKGASLEAEIEAGLLTAAALDQAQIGPRIGDFLVGDFIERRLMGFLSYGVSFCCILVLLTAIGGAIIK